MSRQMKQFFILTFLGIILFIGFIGLFLFVLDMPEIGYVLQIVGAWTSTFVFILMFKKIRPGLSLPEYIKRQFRAKVRMKDFAAVVVFFLIVWLGTALIVSLAQGKNISSVLVSDPKVMLVSFFTCLIRGSLGEEIGWRSFFLNELESKHGFNKAIIINGALWGIWHIPITLVSGGGMTDTLIQIVCNMIALPALVLVMSLIYRNGKNLLMPILLHQAFNYSLSLIVDDSIVSTLGLTLCTSLAAVVFWLIYRKPQGNAVSVE